jgi:hypothetical protein
MVTRTPCDEPAAQLCDGTLWQAGILTDKARHQHTLTNRTDQPWQATGSSPSAASAFTFTQRNSKLGPSAGAVMA